MPALRREREVLGRNPGLATSFTVHNDDDLALPTEVDVGLYRIVHTALTDIVQHADAANVDVVLRIVRKTGALQV
ncbi:MAG: hypothetical protein ABGY41_14290 [Candidatus Poribacteria bacterium]